jgi:predicted PolB exonuclease-like 3'-5' exonuclease
MQEWNHWDFGSTISLVHLAHVLNLNMSKSNGMDGEKVFDSFNAGDHELIADYCMQDVELTRAVYYRMTKLKTLTP